MLNNSGTYGANEAPTNIVASLNRSQSNASNINHNMNDFGKFVQQASAPASGYYEAHNFHNFGQPPLSMSPIMHPFQAYQSMGHGSTYPSQNSQFLYGNAMQDFLPPVSTTAQAEYHNNMLNFNQNFHTKPSGVLESAMVKGYPINIPQVSTKVSQISPIVTKNDLSNPQNMSEYVMNQCIPQVPRSSSGNTSISKKIDSALNVGQGSEKTDTNVPRNVTPSSIIPSKDTNKLPAKAIDQNDTEIPENLSKNVKASENMHQSPPIIQKTMFNIANKSDSSIDMSKTSMLKKTLSETKRKSLEKTVRLIESILIKSSNNTKSDVVENAVDPLAFSPRPEICQSTKESETDSDNEVLVKKQPTKMKDDTPPENATQQDDNTSPSTVDDVAKETQKQEIKVEIEDIKVEPSWIDVETENAFLKDCNGSLRESLGDVKVIFMENSVEEALATVKNGGTSIAYFECPYCSLLIQHPKRFLIHSKWHSFGLLNEKRAELAREREERTREKREARSTQRLNETLAIVSDKSFPCKSCESVFPTRSSLKNHRRKAHPPDPVRQCRICLLPVRDYKTLRAHMTVHEDKVAGGHQCPHCPKRFKYRHSLTKHVDTHLDKTHACPTCGKMFGSEALVQRHGATHLRGPKVASHRCSYCPKAFYESYNLHVHERTHRNDKPFKCDVCQSCFVTNSSLKRHVKVSHSGAKPFPCPICQKCFSTATIRDRHELRVHSDQHQLQFQCQICSRRFMKQKDLRNHSYRLHPKQKDKKDDSEDEQNSS